MKDHSSSNIILMDPFPALGHINAFLELALWLSEKGYKIVFIGLIEHQQIYLDQGFRFYELNPLIFMSESYEIKQKGFFQFFLENLLKSRDRRFLIYFQLVSAPYRRIVQLIRPSLVLLDDHYALKAFFYNDLNLPVVTISTMLSPVMGTIAPPFQSNYVPKDTLMSRIYVNFLWSKNRLIRKLRTLRSGLICLGETDIKIIRRFFIGVLYTLDTSRCYGIGIQQLPMIATYPRPFEFEINGGNKSVAFFGHLPNTAVGDFDDSRLLSLLRRLSETKIIYCSLGTITFNYLKLCHRFFKRIIKVAIENPQWHLILNVGRHYDINKLDYIPENVSVFSHLPQRQLLKHVDIMINHGGMNSIKECLSAHVPMIVYPLSLQWDQPGGAARVYYHNLGVIGNVRRDKYKAISAKIHFLFAHLAEYQGNIRNFNDETTKSNRSEDNKILSLINHYVSQNSQQKPFLDDTSKEAVNRISCSSDG